MNDAVKNENLDLGAMMDQTMDSIPDAPDFNNPPAGVYTLMVKDVAIDKYKSKDEPEVEKQRIKITYSVVETKEVVAGAIPVPNESMFTETFMATEQGLSFFKKAAKNIMNVADLAGVSYADIFASMKGQQFDAVISVKTSEGKKGTKNEGKTFENLQIRVKAPAV